MNFLLLGATGMAGHMIAFYLKEQGHEITTFSRTPFSYMKNICFDVRNIELLKKLIRKNKYDYIINCIGVLNDFAEMDKENAIFLNAYLPHFLVKLTTDMETCIIHLSTDCVFSGTRGAYSENDVTDGSTFYDRSKALGEVIDNKNLTFRNSIIGPDMKQSGIGLFNWFMKQEEYVNGYQKTIWSGVTTLTLAMAIEKAAEQKITGIYHLVNNRSINKFDLLTLFNKYFKNNGVIINPVDGINVNKSLINNREDFIFRVPTYDEMLKDLAVWVTNHPYLYSHYWNTCKRPDLF